MSGDTIRELAALGLSIEQVAGVLDIMERESEARKEKARARLHKHREKKRGETLRNVASELAGSDARGEDNLQTKKISGQEEKKDSLLETEFEREFWPAYPRKVGKRRALKAFVSARKRASLDEILTGLRRYAAERAGEDQQFTKHPEGWLNGDHWTDEPTAKPLPRGSSPPPQRGVMGAARRILESEGNGSESIFGNLGDGEFLPATGSAGQRDASADIPGPFAGLRLVGHR